GANRHLLRVFTQYAAVTHAAADFGRTHAVGTRTAVIGFAEHLAAGQGVALVLVHALVTRHAAGALLGAHGCGFMLVRIGILAALRLVALALGTAMMAMGLLTFVTTGLRRRSLRRCLGVGLRCGGAGRGRRCLGIHCAHGTD